MVVWCCGRSPRLNSSMRTPPHCQTIEILLGEAIFFLIFVCYIPVMFKLHVDTLSLFPFLFLFVPCFSSIPLSSSQYRLKCVKWATSSSIRAVFALQTLSYSSSPPQSSDHSIIITTAFIFIF